MILIIDGYNVLFHECWPYIDGALEKRRNQLIAQVVSYKKEYNLSRVILVFDGCAGIGPYKEIITTGGVEIIYAICQGKADEKIILLSKRLNNVSVVTADREVIKYAKRNRSKIISPDIFSRDLLRRKKRQQRVTIENDVDKWLDEFGLEEEIDIATFKDENIPQVPKYEDYEENEEIEGEPHIHSASVEEWMQWFGWGNKK